VFTHGVLGSGKNWRSFAKRFVTLVEDATGEPQRAILIDSRNHGKSSGKGGPNLGAGPHTLRSAALDFVRTIQHEVEASSNRLSNAQPKLAGLVGHSLGGKIVLEYLSEVAMAPRAAGNEVLVPGVTWVLDSIPSSIRANELVQDTERVMEVVAAVPLEAFDRQAQVMSHLVEAGGLSEPTAMWLCSSLHKCKDSGALRFAFDLAGCREMFRSFKETDRMDVLRSREVAAQTAVHLVRGEKSFRIGDGIYEELAALGTVQLHTLENAGHWLHVDNPHGLLRMMTEPVSRLRPPPTKRAA